MRSTSLFTNDCQLTEKRQPRRITVCESARERRKGEQQKRMRSMNGCEDGGRHERGAADRWRNRLNGRAQRGREPHRHAGRALCDPDRREGRSTAI